MTAAWRESSGGLLAYLQSAFLFFSSFFPLFFPFWVLAPPELTSLQTPSSRITVLCETSTGFPLKSWRTTHYHSPSTPNRGYVARFCPETRGWGASLFPPRPATCLWTCAMVREFDAQGAGACDMDALHSEDKTRYLSYSLKQLPSERQNIGLGLYLT